jgi:hypothetical protein
LRHRRDLDFARKNIFFGPMLPTELDIDIISASPYAGQYGPILFDDPWWKVVAVVVCVVAFILAVIAAVAGLGTAYSGMKGEDFVDLDSGQPGCYNGSVDTWGGEDQLSVAGILSMIAMRVACEE